jgi:secreted trypsin-like serine protease
MTWMRWTLGAAVLGTLATAAACATRDESQEPEAPAPIIGGGAATGAQYNAIGSLATPPAPGYAPRSFCTGTLIDPTHVLTAKHCALQEPTKPDSPTKLDAGPVYFMIGPDARHPLKRVRATAVQAAPIFGVGYTSLGSDVAVYTLSDAITDVPPLKVASMPLGAADTDTKFIVVGYGVQNAAGQSQTRKAGQLTLRAVEGAPAPIAFGSLQAFETAMDVLNPGTFSDAQAAALPFRYDAPLLLDYEVYTGQADGDDQVCNGDSGGPLIRVVDGRPVVFGVASTTMAKRGRLCTNGGIHAVFGAYTRKFIAGFIGETCSTDENGVLSCAAGGADHPSPVCAMVVPADSGVDASAISPYAQCLSSECCGETTSCFGDVECKTLRGCLTACSAPAPDGGVADAGAPADGGVSCAGACYRAHTATIGRYLGFTNCARSCALELQDAGTP